MRLAEVAGALSVSRATAFRILASLQSRGYVEHVRAERVYRIGYAVRALASKSDTSSVLRLAGPAMAELRAATGETVNLALILRGKIAYAAILDGVHALRMQAAVGEEVAVHTTAIGKAVLAALPPDRWESLLPPEPYPALTPRSITGRRGLAESVAAARECGYAVDDEENEAGAACIGAVILGGDGYPLGALSISGPASRMPESDRPELGRLVSHWCAEISAQLGFKPQPERQPEPERALQREPAHRGA
jgi:DNA-binding IclR family transcriptional regulator